VQRYENKVLRYPGHFATFEAYKRLVSLGGPRRRGRRCGRAPTPLPPTARAKITARYIRDVCVIARGRVGEKDGKPARVTWTSWTATTRRPASPAMERLTGWHAAIMMGLQAGGGIAPGPTAWSRR